MKLTSKIIATIIFSILLVPQAISSDSHDFIVEMKVIDSGNEVVFPRMMVDEGAESFLSESGKNSTSVSLRVNSTSETEAHVMAEVNSDQNTISPELLVKKGKWASVSVGELEFHVRVESLAANK